MGSVVVLATVCTAVAFLVMFALIAEAGPARMTLITYVNPAVAVLLGALILDEPLTTGAADRLPVDHRRLGARHLAEFTAFG